MKSSLTKQTEKAESGENNIRGSFLVRLHYDPGAESLCNCFLTTNWCCVLCTGSLNVASKYICIGLYCGTAPNPPKKNKTFFLLSGHINTKLFKKQIHLFLSADSSASRLLPPPSSNLKDFQTATRHHESNESGEAAGESKYPKIFNMRGEG